MRISHFVISLLSVVLLYAIFVPVPASAQQRSGGGGGSTQNDCENASFLGFPAWYSGIAKKNGNSCDIMSPAEVGGINTFIWIIVFNVVEMILRAAGYASVAFIIYGGYRYMTSAGSADGMAAAKRTITNAVIGLVISIAAVAIVRTVSGGLGL